MTTPQPLSSSFRDPNGFVFEEGGHLYRKVRVSYSENYKQLIHSGLYVTLVGKGLLVAHEDSDIDWTSAKVQKTVVMMAFWRSLCFNSPVPPAEMACAAYFEYSRMR